MYYAYCMMNKDDINLVSKFKFTIFKSKINYDDHSLVELDKLITEKIKLIKK